MQGLLFVTEITFIETRVTFSNTKDYFFVMLRGYFLLNVWVTFCNYKGYFIQTPNQFSISLPSL